VEAHKRLSRGAGEKVIEQLMGVQPFVDGVRLGEELLEL